MAETAELTENSTQEDIQAHVEQVVKEVAEERAGEEKSDAQITSEHASTKQPAHTETPAETNSGSEAALEGEESAEADAAEVEDQGEEPGESEGQEWLTDDVKAEAAAYGIDESEIADFASREELDRALRLFDKSALEAGRKAMAEAEGEDDKAPARNERGQFAKKEDAPKADDQPATAGETVDGQYEIKLDKDVYDEEIVDTLTGMRDHYESRLQDLESRLNAADERFSEADAVAEERHFDNLVDKLGHADLFGETNSENPKQLERRHDLMVAVKAQQIGLSQLGRPTEITESLINRVSRMVFAEELGKKDLKKRTRKISKQANGRQGGGATRPQDPSEDPRAEADRLYREFERA
jgi:hypothetical protein